MATLDVRTESYQYCPACEGSASPICYRCGGSGLVPAYDPLLRSIRFRVYAVTRRPNQALDTLRLRVASEVLEPEVVLHA